MRKRILFVIIAFATAFSLQAGNIGALLSELDRAIAQAGIYETEKEDKIAKLKTTLHNRLSPNQEYKINEQLFEAYKDYICDSAMKYVNRNINIAGIQGIPIWMNEAKLEKADLLGKTGLYMEALSLLETIDHNHLPKRLLVKYYITCENSYLYHAEYVSDNEYRPQYLNQLYAYRDSVLQVVDRNSYQYATTKANRLLQDGQGQEALQILENYLTKLSPDTRDYAVMTSIMAYICQTTGDKQLQKEYLIRSATADIRGAVKENNSLRALAELLYEEGQLQRADTYMKRSMEDANFYNARLRNVQAARMLPIIDRAYTVEKEQSRRLLQGFLIATTLLTLFLAYAAWFVIRKSRKLSIARKELALTNEKLTMLNKELTEVNRIQLETNSRLTETNHIKEVYVGRFIELCSLYIDKMENYRRTLNKKASTGKIEEVCKALKSNRFIEEELKEFHQNFDTSFLNIFPNFVERFNALLPKDEQIQLKQEERLTTELRIFALIRLGITDSAKIAGFLRYSITTIYTYRSKMKNRSLFRDNFEEKVMEIGAFQHTKG